MEIKINETDTCAIHRLPNRGGAPATIVAQFNSRDKKIDLVKAIKKKKPKTEMLGYIVDNPIYGEDQLTQKNKEILLKTKKLRREGIYMFVWVRDGQVFVRENAEGRTYKIMDMAQLDGE